MKLFLISQKENDDYDVYDSAVVAAETKEIARAMDPSNGKPKVFGERFWNDWCKSIDDVEVKYLGEAAPGIEQGVICASFNAG